MVTPDPDEAPPRALTKNDPAGVSTELPAVVFRDEDETLISSEVPRVRLLQGRVPENWVLYSIYAFDLMAGLFAMSFALGTREWSSPMIWLAWSLLALWNWFYGVAYRYRRRVLKYASVFVILGLTAALVYFSIERAQPQVAMIGPNEVGMRGEAAELYWSAGATMIAAGLLIAHLVFLGRGYRRKKP